MLIIPIQLAILSHGHSQVKPVFHNFSIENGLTHSNITAITEDNLGFVWIGTTEGLHRFDGKNFRVFEETSGGNTIPTNQISYLFSPVNQNFILIGCVEGNLSVYNLQTGLFANHKLMTLASGEEGKVTAIASLGESSFLIGTSVPARLFVFNLKVSTFKEIGISVASNGTNALTAINHILIDGQHSVWLSTNIGLVRGDSSLARFDRVEGSNQFTSSPIGIMAATSLDSENLLLTTTSGILRYSINRREFSESTPRNFPRTIINTHIQDSKGNIWIATRSSGLLCYRPKQNTYTQYRYTPSNRNAIPNNYITTLFFSGREVTVWVGTQGGFSFFGLDVNPFSHYTPMLRGNDVIEDNFGMLKTSTGSIWIHGPTTLYYADSIGGIFKTVNQNPFTIDGLIGRTVTKIWEDSQKKLWFATSNGLVEFNPITNSSRSYTIQPGKEVGRYGNFFTSCHHYNDTLWISTGSGFCSFSLTERKFTTYPPIVENGNGDRLLAIRDIVYEPGGYVWIGVNLKGVYRYNLTTNKYKHYTNNPSDSTSLSSNSFVSFFRDRGNNIWVATYYLGINRFNPERNTFTRYTKKEGLPSNTVYGIMQDPKQNLWMSTNKGISRFDQANHQFYNFDFFDGIFIYEFNMKSFCQTIDGTMMFGGVGGIVSFDPLQIKELTTPPDFYVTSIYIQNHEVLATSDILGNLSIIFRDRIDLKYQKATISFDVTLLNFLYPQRSGFAWKLTSYDKEWNIARPNQTAISYTNLPPGKYELHLKSTVNSRLWSAEKKVLTINVIPPWWLSIWFKIVLIASVALGIPMFYTLRIQYLKKQREHLNQLVAEKTEELKALNESLEESNAEITAQNEELEKHRHYLEDIVDERTHQLKSALLKAEESDKLKTAILSNMSHEVRTPLNAIVGYTKLINDESTNSQERSNYTDVILHSSQTLLTLIDNIIELSRFQSENYFVNPEWFNPNGLINTIAGEFAKRLSFDVQLITDFTGDNDYMLFADKQKIGSTITNLLSNAIKYTEKGYVKVGYRQVDRNVLENEYGLKFTSNSELFMLFYVEDTGYGISPNKCEVIFDLFTKGEDYGHKLYEGLGLGLTVCKISVELMGGTIWLKSEPCKGSTFYFIVPIIRVSQKA